MAEIVLQNIIFLSQKRVGVGGFRPIISEILFFFLSLFTLQTWKYAIVSSNCALLSAIFSAFFADNKFIFDLKKKRGEILKITLIIGQKIRKSTR